MNTVLPVCTNERNIFEELNIRC